MLPEADPREEGRQKAAARDRHAADIIPDIQEHFDILAATCAADRITHMTALQKAVGYRFYRYPAVFFMY